MLLKIILVLIVMGSFCGAGVIYCKGCEESETTTMETNDIENEGVEVGADGPTDNNLHIGPIIMVPLSCKTGYRLDPRNRCRRVIQF
jgi:hypothetical protein